MKNLLRIALILVSLNSNNAFSEQGYAKFAIMGDNYLDLDFTQNPEATVVTLTGPKIRSTFNDSRVRYLKIGISTPSCESRPGDDNIQNCYTGNVLSVRLLDENGIDLDIPTGVVNWSDISTWTSRVLLTDPTYDYTIRSFRVQLKTELLGLQIFEGDERQN